MRSSVHVERPKNAHRLEQSCALDTAEVDEVDSCAHRRRWGAGRFQLEAAIQSAHAQRLRSGRTEWETIALLYEGLVALAPTMGARVGRAAAIAQVRGPQAGWDLIEAIPREQATTYQPYWALAGHLLNALGLTVESVKAYQLAVGLCEDPTMRDWLRNQMPDTCR
jgi:predicted RNA polymerase sigma factor